MTYIMCIFSEAVSKGITQNYIPFFRFRFKDLNLDPKTILNIS